MKGCSEVFEVRVPASTSNLGCGFDTLSLALQLHLRVRVTPGGSGVRSVARSAEFSFSDAENLLEQAARRICQRCGCTLPGFQAEILEGIPVGKGLGSSAAALVAGILLADRLCGLHLDQQRVIELASEMEGHPDNVAAAVLGGLVVAAQARDRIIYRRFPLAARWRFVVVVPDFPLPTHQARALLPDDYARGDVVHNLQRVALLATTLAGGEFPADRELLDDRIHEPYRAALVPGFEEMRALRREGLVGVTLSGAGPSVLLWCLSNHDENGLAVVEVFKRHGVKSDYFAFTADDTGAQIQAAESRQ